MNRIAIISVAALASAACMSGPSLARGDGPSARQQRLERMLDGRTAEPTVACVNQRDLRDANSLADGSILFQGRSSRYVYVNRPPAGCPGLGMGRSIRSRTTTTQLCRGDIIEVFDPLNDFGFGGCGLGDFTPYRRDGRPS